MTSQQKKWARVVFTLLLILLGFKAFGDEYGQVPLLSGINLAIHEFGHYLFMPFGETPMFFGGSLFQVLFPMVFVWYLARGPKEERRDLHAATVCLWWASMNVLSVAIYAGASQAGD